LVGILGVGWPGIAAMTPQSHGLDDGARCQASAPGRDTPRR
jgi:hypothetical protein